MRGSRRTRVRADAFQNLLDVPDIIRRIKHTIQIGRRQTFFEAGSEPPALGNCRRSARLSSHAPDFAIGFVPAQTLVNQGQEESLRGDQFHRFEHVRFMFSGVHL